MSALGACFDGAPWEPTMLAYQERRDIAFRPFFDQTLGAADARDDADDQLDNLRAVLLNQHDARRVLRALPGVLDDAFEPMDRFRHAFVKNMFEAAQEAPSVPAT